MVPPVSASDGSEPLPIQTVATKSNNQESKLTAFEKSELALADKFSSLIFISTFNQTLAGTHGTKI